MKKFLILTVTSGSGHNSCAMSAKRELEAKGDVEVKVVDLLKEYSTPLRAWLVDKGYSISVGKLLLPVFNSLYYHYRKADPKKRYSCPAQAVSVSTLTGLMQEILEFQPDVIFCTHFYAGVALTDLKLVYDLPMKTVITNFDYVNSPFWEASIGVDYFNIPNEDFVDECIEEGYKKDQLLCFGIPVDGRTLHVTDKAVARAELGLDNDVFTVMVMFGGGHWKGGFPIFRNLVRALEQKGERAQVIMINGRDKSGYEKVQKMKIADNVKVVNVGFTDKVPLYMSASDLIVNKYGGTSLTEMLNQGLPMLITEKVPGQEECNLEYMKKKGVVKSFRTKAELRDNLYLLMDDEGLRRDMAQKAHAMRTRGIERLTDFMLELPNADYTELLAQNIDVSEVKKKVKKAMKIADKKERSK